jgi:hypothetical protein
MVTRILLKLDWVGDAVRSVYGLCLQCPRLEAALSNVVGNILRQELEPEHNFTLGVEKRQRDKSYTGK